MILIGIPLRISVGVCGVILPSPSANSAWGRLAECAGLLVIKLAINAAGDLCEAINA